MANVKFNRSDSAEHHSEGEAIKNLHTVIVFQCLIFVRFALDAIAFLCGKGKTDKYEVLGNYYKGDSINSMAASTWTRVVSTRGREDCSGLTSIPISVQPRITAWAP